MSTVINEDMSNKILNAQLNDNLCGNMLKNGINTVNKQRGFTERNSLIRKANRIFIPQNNELRNYLLNQFHDNSGRFGREKTINLLPRYFYWNNIFDLFNEYVRSCIACQRNKSSNKLPHGLLEPLEIPDMR